MKAVASSANGLKQTEIGEVPSDWDTATLREKYSFTKKPRGLRLEKFEMIPFVPMDLIPYASPSFADYLLKKPSEISSGTYFEAGDILLPKITPSFENGKQGIIHDLPHGFGMATTEVIPINQVAGVSDRLFLFYYLLKDDIRDGLAGKMEGSTGRQRLSKAVLEELHIPFPPLPEQKRIAGFLFKIQQVIVLQEKLITKTRELKAALIQKLFTEGLHGEEQKQTEIGLIPKSWELQRVGEICEKPTYGYTERASEKPVGPRFLRITDITEQGVDWSQVPYCKCPHKFLPKYQLKQGDILFARIGATTGKSYLVENPPVAIYASYLIRVRTNPTLSPSYLYHYFNSELYWKQVNANKGSNLKKGVNGSILARLLVPIPKDRDEQRQIADVLVAVDGKIARATTRKRRLQALFHSMLHQLMTGKIRVKDLDLVTENV
ncbi:MAG: restriction endonuclease subunit S [Candidatus Omnitrophica bacterium]|nr:restriction endonuclease subunit S [Candidatus Omnitrophota bacterium]